jgi:hypothetical protein
MSGEPAGSRGANLEAQHERDRAPLVLPFALSAAATSCCAIRLASPTRRPDGRKLLARAINVQLETTVRRGIAPDLVAREVRALENAIRAELVRLAIRESDTA